MLFSQQQLFSDNQAITATAASTNILDTLAAGTPYAAAAAVEKNLGKGVPVALSVRVTEAFNTLTSLTVTLEVDNDVAFGSAKVVRTQTIALAALILGTDLDFRYVPKGADERYMRLNYTVTGTNPTLGKIHAGVVCGHDDRFGA